MGSYQKLADLYCKNRVICITDRMPSCVYTVFFRVFLKRAHFPRVLPCKMSFSINLIFNRVLPGKSQNRDPQWTPKWTPKSSQDRPKPVKTRVILHAHAKTPGFYRVNRRSDRPKWPQNGGPKKDVFLDAFTRPPRRDLPVFYLVKWASLRTYLDTEREARDNLFNDPYARLF